MPVQRVPLSISQLAELVGVEPWRLLDIEVNRLKQTANLVLEPEETDMGKSKSGGKKMGGKKGC